MEPGIRGIERIKVVDFGVASIKWQSTRDRGEGPAEISGTPIYMSPEQCRDQVDEVWKALGMDMGKATELCLHYVQACPGTAVCKFGQQDSLGLGMKIEDFFIGMVLPAKVKIGVSGCPFCCGESFVRDIGVFGKKAGWNLVVGGSSARRPRVGDLIREQLSEAEVIPLVKRALEYYRDRSKKRERMARFVDRIGIENVKDAIC